MKLPAGATPKFFTFSFSWDAPPAGTLQGFETASKVQYFAEILSGSGIFKGYRRSSPLCPEEYYKDPLYVTAPTAPAPVYYFQSFTQSPDCGYKWVESSYQFAPTNGTTVSLPLISTGTVNNTSYFANCPTTDDYILAGSVKYYKTAALSATEKQQLESVWGAIKGMYGFNGAITFIEGVDINNEKIKQEGDAKNLKEFVPTSGRIKFGTKYLLLFYGAGDFTTCELQAINKNIDALQKSSIYKYDFSLTNQWLDTFFQSTDEAVIQTQKEAIKNGLPLAGSTLERAQWSKNLLTTAAFVYYAGFAKLGCSLGEEVYYTQAGTNPDGSALWQLNSGQSCGSAFGAGALKSLTEDLDVVTMLAGVSELVKEAIAQGGKNWINYPQDLRTFQNKLATEPNAITSDDIVGILPPPVKTNVQAAQKVANVAQFFYKYYGPDVNCWRAGNLSAQVVPVVFTLGAVLVPKVATVVTKGVGRLGRLVGIFGKEGLAQKITDGLAEYGEFLTSTGRKVEQTIIKEDGIVKSVTEEIQDATTGKKTTIKVCGFCLAQNTQLYSTNATYTGVTTNQRIQTLEKDGSTAWRPILGKVHDKVESVVSIWVNGQNIVSSPSHEFLTSTGNISAVSLKKGTLLYSLALSSWLAIDSMAVVHEPTEVEGLVVGDVQGYGVSALGILVNESRKCPRKVNFDEASLKALEDLMGSKYDEMIGLMDKLTKGKYNLEYKNNKLKLIDKDGIEWIEEITASQFKAKGGTNPWNEFLDIEPPLMKSFEYRIDNNFIYNTDELGRVSKITIENLDITQTRPRNNYQQQKAKSLKDGKTTDVDGATDDGGHMAAAQFWGPSEQINYFPQNADMNRRPSVTNNTPGDWYKMEEELKQLRQSNPTATIKVEITPNFGDIARPKRPDRFIVDVQVNSVPILAPYNIPNP